MYIGKPFKFRVNIVYANSKYYLISGAGISRSASVCIAYVMNKEKVSYSKAFSLVAAVRPGIEPNDGFVEQLKEYQKELNILE